MTHAARHAENRRDGQYAVATFLMILLACCQSHDDDDGDVRVSHERKHITERVSHFRNAMNIRHWYMALRVGTEGQWLGPAQISEPILLGYSRG